MPSFSSLHSRGVGTLALAARTQRHLPHAIDVCRLPPPGLNGLHREQFRQAPALPVAGLGQHPRNDRLLALLSPFSLS